MPREQTGGFDRLCRDLLSYESGHTKLAPLASGILTLAPLSFSLWVVAIDLPAPRRQFDNVA